MKQILDCDFNSLFNQFCESDRLYYESAIEYLSQNTSLDTQNLQELPSCAKLFVTKYVDLLKRDLSVSSESLGGMSQSFKDEGIDKAIDSLAKGLLGDYKNSDFKFYPIKSRW